MHASIKELGVCVGREAGGKDEGWREKGRTRGGRRRVGRGEGRIGGWGHDLVVSNTLISLIPQAGRFLSANVTPIPRRV